MSASFCHILSMWPKSCVKTCLAKDRNSLMMYVPCGTVGQDRHTGSGLHGNPWDILTMSHVGHSYVGQWILLANLDMSGSKLAK